MGKEGEGERRGGEGHKGDTGPQLGLWGTHLGCLSTALPLGARASLGLQMQTWVGLCLPNPEPEHVGRFVQLRLAGAGEGTFPRHKG